jgi:hypothetical protein
VSLGAVQYTTQALHRSTSKLPQCDDLEVSFLRVLRVVNDPPDTAVLERACSKSFMLRGRMCAKVAALVRAGSMPSDEREGRERGERKVESETYSL